MSDIDLRQLSDSDVVLHFGGRPNEVDAFTFSNALISIADALRELNNQLNSNFSIEVVIEGVGPGSFRAKIGTKLKSLSGLFGGDARNLLVSLLGCFIYAHVLDPTAPPTIVVNDDSVVFQTGRDRVIIPRITWEAKAHLKKPELVERNIARAFEAMEEDPSVTDFGLARGLHEPEPIGIIPRSDFALLARLGQSEPSPEPNKFKDERTNVTVLKIVFERGNRKWQFVWNGFKISAPITDEEFFTKLESREYVFAQGDVLDVTLRIHQVMDSLNNVLINDHYEVVKVHGLVVVPKQQPLF
jgi:hypothetical protein